MLEGTFYGLIVCGYLFWMSVLWSIGEKEKT